MKKERKTRFTHALNTAMLLLFVMVVFCFISVPVEAAGSDGDFIIQFEEKSGKTDLAVDMVSVETLVENTQEDSIWEAYFDGNYTIKIYDIDRNIIDTNNYIDNLDANIFYAEFSISDRTYTSNYLLWEGSDSNSGDSIAIDHCTNTTITYTVSSNKENISSIGNYYFAKKTLLFAKAGELKLSNEGGWSMYTSTDGLVWTPYGIGTSMKINAGTSLKLLIKGDSGQTGKLTYSYRSLGQSLEGYNSKEKALDISAGYDGTKITYEKTYKEVWYKLTINKASVVTFTLTEGSLDTYVDLYDANGKTQLADEKKELNRKAGDAIPFYLWDRQNSENKYGEDGIATKTLYKPGTYYLYVKRSSGYNGKLKYSRRDYIPISSVSFQKGNNVVLSSSGGAEYYDNRITGIFPSNADGQIVSVKYDSAYINKESGLTAKTKKFGTSVVRYYDERGVEVAQVQVSVIPISITEASFEGGLKNIKISLANACTANYLRVYQQKGSQWTCIATVPKNGNYVEYNVGNLSPQTNYQFRLTFYDSASGTESKQTVAFTAGTALKTKTAIKKVSKIKYGRYKDAYVHNPGRWNEWREPYTVYTAKSTVSLKKVKGCKEYELEGLKKYLSNTNLFVKKTTNKNVLLASAQHGKKRLPKTLKLKVRTVRRINSYAVAYGPWSKIKKVKVR